MIRQSWRYKEWPAGHYSQVKIEFEENGEETTLKLSQTGVPSSDLDRTRGNWEKYYWDSIRVTFGYGSYLL